MSSTNYLVNNSIVLSSNIKYNAALSASQVFVSPEDNIQQFGSVTFSIQLSALVPVTFLVEVSNATTWQTLVSFNPDNTMFTLQRPISYKKMRVTITCGLTPITLVNFCTLYSTDLAGPSLKEPQATFSATDLYSLSLGQTIGPTKMVNSSTIYGTLSADRAVRTLDSTKTYALDGQQNMTQQVQLQNVLGPDQTYLNAGNVTYTNGISMTPDSVIRSSGNINYGSSSILVLRASGTFLNGTDNTSLATVSIGANGIGFGAFDTGSFGIFYSSGGQFPVATTVVTGPITTGGSIQVTIGTNVFTVSGLTISSTVCDSAAQITAGFNADAANSLYRARQYGSTVIFVGTVAVNVSGISINPGATGLTTTNTVTVTGVPSVFTFIDSNDFNILPFQWTPGNYLELQLTVQNNGRYIKLSAVNEGTQELVDLTTAILPYRFGQSTMPIIATCTGPNTAMTIDNAILYSITDTLPRGPQVIGTDILQMNNVPVQTGNLGVPIGFISRTGTGPVAVLKKIVVMNHGPSRLYLMLSKGIVAGPNILDSSSAGTYVSINYTTSVVPIGSMTIVYGQVIYADNIDTSEILLNWPIETGMSLMVSVSAGTFTSSTADIVFFVEYHT